MLRADVDTIVLGCTHYPFVRSQIEEIVGPDVTIIDPAPAVARQTQRVLKQNRLLNVEGNPGRAAAFTTAEPGELDSLIQKLLGSPIPVRQATWKSGQLER